MAGTPGHSIPTPFAALDNTADSWFFSSISDDHDILSPSTPSNSEVLPAHDAMLIQQLFYEKVVPHIPHMIEDAGAHTSGHPQESFPSPSMETDSDELEDLQTVRMDLRPLPEPVDEDSMARAFAVKRRTSVSETLKEQKILKWNLLIDIMMAKYFSAAGTQTMQPFYGWRKEMYIEFITTTYDSLVRGGITDFELREFPIEKKTRNGDKLTVNAHTTLSDPDFMEALSKMLSDKFPRILIAYWGSVATALVRLVLPPGTPNRVETARRLARQTSMEEIYTFPFLHDTSEPVVNYYSRPEFLATLRLALTSVGTDTFTGIFLTNISHEGVVTFRLLHHSNVHTTSVVAGLILTALDLIGQKKGGLLEHPWTSGDIKDKKFREMQKAMNEEIRTTLSCGCDTVVVPMERQRARANNLIYAFVADENATV